MYCTCIGKNISRAYGKVGQSLWTLVSLEPVVAKYRLTVAVKIHLADIQGGPKKVSHHSLHNHNLVDLHNSFTVT